MIVRIPKAEIKRGMFVESVECAEALFGKRRFVLKEDRDLQAIQESSAEFVLINTAFGADTAKAKMAAANYGVRKPLSPEEARVSGLLCNCALVHAS